MKIIQVAGTNGKGSVSAYIASILTAAGVKCGLFISPHLVEEEERISIDGKNISREEMQRLMAENEGPNLFYTYCNAAMAWFTANRVEVAVMETGLGGRLDPVTQLPTDIMVITRIGMDHMDTLGDTIQKIAIEKCAIVHKNGYVVAMEQQLEVERILETACELTNARLVFVRQSDLVQNYGGFDYEGMENLCVNMIGSKQPLNAAVAVRAVMALSHYGIYVELPAIREGLRSMRLAARLQYFKDEDILLDGAHNNDAVAELERALVEHFDGRKLVMLCAAMRDKEVSFFGWMAERRNMSVVTTQLPEERCRTAQEMAQLFDPARTTVVADLEEAYATARQMAAEQGALLVITGSLHLAGAMLAIIQKEQEAAAARRPWDDLEE
ncbi:MAG: hypothetical protein IJP03_04030 [Christensenellaceae bacterium]|nr:hypothetical protein [Christensenellaceae bacterium]